MKYEINLVDWQAFHCPEVIELKDLSLYNFESAINTFKEEIDWSLMWDLEEAQHRLDDGWKLIAFIPEDVVLGWFWLNPKYQSVHNLWIQLDWSGRGWGTKMYLSISTLAQSLGLTYLQTYVDDWNLAGQRVAEKAGWQWVS